jgi:acyl-CoA synthetase (AMP-forming)/AMP-acid ligase II
VDGILHIRSDTPMLGYLNAPSPFTEDGWLATGDAVEVDGERLRILGRRSELISVGGEKVYPAEVEGVILACPNVADAVVYGEKNPITGAIVCARVRLREPEEKTQFLARVREFCGQHLQRYKIPVRITLTEEPLHGGRFKKLRR